MKTPRDLISDLDPAEFALQRRIVEDFIQQLGQAGRDAEKENMQLLADFLDDVAEIRRNYYDDTQPLPTSDQLRYELYQQGGFWGNESELLHELLSRSAIVEVVKQEVDDLQDTGSYWSVRSATLLEDALERFGEAERNSKRSAFRTYAITDEEASDPPVVPMEVRPGLSGVMVGIENDDAEPVWTVIVDAYLDQAKVAILDHREPNMPSSETILTQSIEKEMSKDQKLYY
jgi:hypothetical protein